MWERLKAKKLYFGIFLIAFTGFAYARAMKENEFGDFHVFWYAAKTLWNGGDVYLVENGWRAFYYPPFAAFIFSPLAIFPFKIACFLFFLLNGYMFYYTIGLNRKVLEFLPINNDYKKIFNIIGALLIFKISWNNIMMIQVNQFVYIFIYLGILNFLGKRENLAVFWMSIAISLKVFPIIFALWFAIRGSYKIILKFSGWAVLFICIPFLFSGVQNGVKQLDWYLHDYLLDRASIHEIGSGYASQSLPSLLGRTLTKPEVLKEEPDYSLINLSPEMTKKVIFSSQMILLGMMLALFFYLRIKKYPVTALESGIVILTLHLFSTATWKAHMVGVFLPLSLVGGYLYVKYKESFLTLIDKFYLTFTILVCFLGQIFIGKKIQMYLGAYGDYTFVMVFTLFYLYRFYWETESPYQFIKSEITAS